MISISKKYRQCLLIYAFCRQILLYSRNYLVFKAFNIVVFDSCLYFIY